MTARLIKAQPLDDLVRARVTGAFKQRVIVAAHLAGKRDYSDLVREALTEKTEAIRAQNPALFASLLGV
jgi:hypothetical protein